MYGFYRDWGEGHSIFGAIIMFLLLVLVVAFIIGLLRSNTTDVHREHREKALDIIKERYAKGEINKEEFEIKKKDLI